VLWFNIHIFIILKYNKSMKIFLFQRKYKEINYILIVFNIFLKKRIFIIIKIETTIYLIIIIKKLNHDI